MDRIDASLVVGLCIGFPIAFNLFSRVLPTWLSIALAIPLGFFATAFVTLMALDEVARRRRRLNRKTPQV